MEQRVQQRASGPRAELPGLAGAEDMWSACLPQLAYFGQCQWQPGAAFPAQGVANSRKGGPRASAGEGTDDISMHRGDMELLHKEVLFTFFFCQKPKVSVNSFLSFSVSLSRSPYLCLSL